MKRALALLAFLPIATHADDKLPTPFNSKPLPPVEYDRPYDGPGQMVILRVSDNAMSLCPKTVFPVTLACTIKLANGCLVLMAKKETIEAVGWNEDIIKRHERAHCNGWPHEHPGARRLDEDQPTRKTVQQ